MADEPTWRRAGIPRSAAVLAGASLGRWRCRRQIAGSRAAATAATRDRSAALAADLGREGLLLAVALDDDLDRVARRVLAHDLAELLVRRDVLAVHPDDDVALLQARDV